MIFRNKVILCDEYDYVLWSLSSGSLNVSSGFFIYSHVLNAYLRRSSKNLLL